MSHVNKVEVNNQHSPHVVVDGIPLAKLNAEFSHPDAQWFHEKVAYGVKYAESHGGDLPHKLFWDFVIKRHDLAPERFDQYHHTLGRLVERCEEVRKPVCDPVCSTVCPAPPCVPICEVTPEPSTFCMGAIAVLLICICRKWRIN